MYSSYSNHVSIKVMDDIRYEPIEEGDTPDREKELIAEILRV